MNEIGISLRSPRPVLVGGNIIVSPEIQVSELCTSDAIDKYLDTHGRTEGNITYHIHGGILVIRDAGYPNTYYAILPKPTKKFDRYGYDFDIEVTMPDTLWRK